MPILAAILNVLFATTVADVLTWPDSAYMKQSQCCLTGTVAAVQSSSIILDDGTGRIRLWTYQFKESMKPGDIVNARCRAIIDDAKKNILNLRQFEVTGHTEPPRPEETTVARIVRGEHDLAPVRVRGMVVGAMNDDIQPSNSFLMLSDGQETAVVAVPRASEPERLVGANVEVTGLCDPEMGSWRLFQGRGILSLSKEKLLKVIAPAPTDPFSAPPIGTAASISPQTAVALGRRSATGRVLATWHGDSLLLKAARRGRWKILQAVLAKGQRPPKCGDTVQVTGFPRTDLFTVTLDNALCRTSPAVAPEDNAVDRPPEEVTAATLLKNEQGEDQVQAPYHGRVIRIRGKVRSVPTENFNENRMQLQSGEHIVPIDASACPSAFAGVMRDCEVEVTGVCLLMADPWRADAPVPRVRGFAVVVRNAGDMRVLARPPWWTTARLLAVIGALLLLVAGVLAWNWTLRRVVAERSRKLLKTEIGKAESDLRIAERTRLAADLHDSIAQTLAGVAFQIDAASGTLERDMKATAGFLDIARRTLLSCREELRRCLWDLRGNSLEENDFAKALRRAVRPVCGSAEISLRFAARRSRLSDSTAHAILCIVRELCANAARHGGAKNVRIAGATEENAIKFSVRDDGRGFDVASIPGPAEGHFGLQGVRERVARLGGSMEIESSPGKETKVTVEIRKS